MLSMMGKKFSRQHSEIVIFFQKIGFDIACRLSPEETICMEYQSLFSPQESICMSCQSLLSGKNKKNIHLSSVEFAKGVVKV